MAQEMKDSFALFLEISLLSSKRGLPHGRAVLVIAVASNQHGRSRPNLCLRLFCKWDKIVKIKRKNRHTGSTERALLSGAVSPDMKGKTEKRPPDYGPLD